MQFHEQIESIIEVFDATIIDTVEFTHADLWRMRNMAAPKRPEKPVVPIADEEEIDDIEDPHVPETLQGESVDAKTAASITAAEKMGKLEAHEMWQISNPPIVYFIERHFFVNGRWEKETLTLRAGSYEEYQYKRGLFEIEWEKRYEEAALAAEYAEQAQQPQPAPQAPPPQPPPPQAPPAQQQQPAGEPYCETHGKYYKRHEKNGEVWHSHPIAQKPDGGWTYCRLRT